MSTKLLSLLGLEKIISPKTIEKGITKLQPKLGKFFKNAEKAGYGAGAAIGFLNSNLTGRKTTPSPGERPDETAMREVSRQRDIPKNLLKSAGSIAAGAATGGLAGAGLAGVGNLLGGTSQGTPQDAQQDVEEQVEPAPQEEALPQELSMLDRVRQIDDTLANELESMLGENIPISEIEKSLKTSRSLLNRTLRLERTLKSPISKILEEIQLGTTSPIGDKNQIGSEKPSEFQRALNTFTELMKQ